MSRPLIIALILLSGAARAADHILSIGGGSSASNTQVSLEKNILFFQKSLSDSGLSGLPHEILFADGGDGARDVKFFDPAFEVPEVNQLLADVFGWGGVSEQYRAHSIANQWGPSSAAGVKKWFDTVGSTLADGDRLFIYFTGHGGAGHGNPPIDQTLALWNEKGMTVHEFDKLLDGLPKGVSVVLIMVQCYGGGFADVIYNGADSNKNLSNVHRCGFFATVPTRMAAGCTPEINEDNYRDYSTDFWAALFGKTRSGERVTPPDYDGDGTVSLAEAHAYTAIHSDTIDIPVRTSEMFLRKLANADREGGLVNRVFSTTQPADRLLSNINFETLLQDESSGDRAILKQLAASIGLMSSPRTLTDARTAAEGFDRERRALDRRMQRLRQDRDNLRQSLQAVVKSRWPELANPYHPQAAEIIRTSADEIVACIKSAPGWRRFKSLNENIDSMAAQYEQYDVKWARHQRFIRAVENAVLAANLPKLTTPDKVREYEGLVELEKGVFSRAK